MERSLVEAFVLYKLFSNRSRVGVRERAGHGFYFLKNCYKYDLLL